DAGLLGQIASDRCRIACILLVAERQHANALSLRHPEKIGNRDAGHGINGLDPVELYRIDDEMEAIRQLLVSSGCICINALHCRCGHFAPSKSSLWYRIEVSPVLQSARRGLSTAMYARAPDVRHARCRALPMRPRFPCDQRPIAGRD